MDDRDSLRISVAGQAGAGVIGRAEDGIVLRFKLQRLGRRITFLRLWQDGLVQGYIATLNLFLSVLVDASRIVRFL
jgi:hypothetical protein